MFNLKSDKTKLHEKCQYAEGTDFGDVENGYKITVVFNSFNMGYFQQWLLLDFGQKPFTWRKLGVRLGSCEVPLTYLPSASNVKGAEEDRWTSGNRKITRLSALNVEQVDEVLLTKYKAPTMTTNNPKLRRVMDSKCYKNNMHALLQMEEWERTRILSR